MEFENILINPTLRWDKQKSEVFAPPKSHPRTVETPDDWKVKSSPGVGEHALDVPEVHHDPDGAGMRIMLFATDWEVKFTQDVKLKAGQRYILKAVLDLSKINDASSDIYEFVLGIKGDGFNQSHESRSSSKNRAFEAFTVVESAADQDAEFRFVVKQPRANVNGEIKITALTLEEAPAGFGGDGVAVVGDVSDEPQPDTGGDEINTCIGTVNATTLNIRSGPGVSFGKVGSLKKGEKIAIISKSKKVDELFWYEIAFGTGGWVSSPFVDSDADCIEKLPTFQHEDFPDPEPPSSDPEPIPPPETTEPVNPVQLFAFMTADEIRTVIPIMENVLNRMKEALKESA